MIRIVTSRHLAALNTELATARDRVTELEAEASLAADQLAAAREESQVRGRTINGLQGEVAELLAEVGQGEQALNRAREECDRVSRIPVRVFVLSHQGELHSVHTTDAAAKHATGLADAEWHEPPSGRRLVDSLWRVSPLPVQREATS